MRGFSRGQYGVSCIVPLNGNERAQERRAADLMREAQDRQMSRLAFLAAAAVLAACSLALACPAHAVAYDYWYKVYDADMNLLYWSEDADAAVTSIDVNKLQEGIWFECYYNGRVNPLPSVSCTGCSCYVTDCSTGDIIGTYDNVGIYFAGDTSGSIDYERSDCLTTDKYGNTVFQFDDDGYFCGILYRMKFYEIGTVSAGTDIEFSMYIVSYISNVGNVDTEATCATFTLTATASSEEEEEEEGERGDSDTQQDADDEASSEDAGAVGQDDGASGGKLAGGLGDDTGSSDGTSGVTGGSDGAASSVSALSDGGGSEAGTSRMSLLSDSVALSEGDSDERGAAAQHADTTAADASTDTDAAADVGADAAAGAASGASDEDVAESAVQTLSSLGTVFSVSGVREQTADVMAVTGLPWLYVLLAALLAAAAPCGALGCAARRRRGVVASSRLIGV